MYVLSQRDRTTEEGMLDLLSSGDTQMTDNPDDNCPVCLKGGTHGDMCDACYDRDCEENSHCPICGDLCDRMELLEHGAHEKCAIDQ